MSFWMKIESRWRAASDKERSRWAFLAFFAVLVLLSVLLYWRFIFQDYLLIYFEHGSDSVGQTVPFLQNGASRFENGDLSFWNQFQFLGAVTGQFLNPDYFPALLGEQHVARMMVVYQLVKIILAGVFFYLFTGYLKLSYRTRFIVALGYAFCGRMLALAAWPAYTLEITLIAAVLWGFERYYADQRRVVVLPVALAAIPMGMGIYDLVLYVIILLAYAVFRVGFSWDERWNAKRASRFFGVLVLLVAASVVIALPVLLPYLDMYATSPRMASDLSAGGFNLAGLFALSSPQVLATEVVRMFGINTLGTMRHFTGHLYPLNSPAYYCGIVALLALPFAFRGRTRRQKGWLAYILVAALIYFFLKGFRYLFNGFSADGDDFRQSSFWITIVILVVAAYGLEWLWGHAERARVAVWAAVLLILLFLSASVIADEVSWFYIVLAACFVVAFAALFIAWRTAGVASSSAKLLLAAIVVLVPVEVVAQGYKQVTGGTTMVASDFIAQYDTDPEDAVLAVADEPEDTYRIDYKSALLTRSMADTYLGTQAYIGGSGIQQSATDFLKAVGNSYIDEMGYSRYVYGFYDDALNSLLGVRYLVYSSCNQDYFTPFGYHEVADDGVYRVLKNEYALPLMYGYAADEVITQDDLEQVPRSDRDLQMLSTVVVPDEYVEADTGALMDMSTQRAASPVVAQTDESVTLNSGVRLTLSARSAEGGYLELAFKLSAQPTTSGNLHILATFSDSATGEKEQVDYYTAAGEEDVYLPVRDEGFDSLTLEISATNVCDDAVVDNIVIRECSPTYFDPFVDAVQARLSSNPQVSSYHAGRLKGSINMQESGYLATSIPWDSSWQVYVDGQQVDPTKVNVGFVGAPLAAGEHTIELVFDDAPRIASYCFSGGMIVALLAISGGFLWAARRRDVKR